MSDQDDFMNIIGNNNLHNLQSESELYNMTIKDLITGMRSIAESVMIVADFIDSFFEAVAEETEEENRPALSTENIIHCKDMFAASELFCESILDSQEFIIFEGDEEEEDNDE